MIFKFKIQIISLSSSRHSESRKQTPLVGLGIIFFQLPCFSLCFIFLSIGLISIKISLNIKLDPVIKAYEFR